MKATRIDIEPFVDGILFTIAASFEQHPYDLTINYHCGLTLFELAFNSGNARTAILSKGGISLLTSCVLRYPTATKQAATSSTSTSTSTSTSLHLICIHIYIYISPGIRIARPALRHRSVGHVWAPHEATQPGAAYWHACWLVPGSGLMGRRRLDRRREG